MNWEEYHEEMMKDAEYKAEYDALEEEYNELRRKLKKEIAAREKVTRRRFMTFRPFHQTVNLSCRRAI